MKYIPTDKLIAELRRFVEEETPISMGSDYYHGATDMADTLLSFITSLQHEQESVAERFARIVRGDLIGINKEVQQKFEQLYFEVTGNKMYGGYND